MTVTSETPDSAGAPVSADAAGSVSETTRSRRWGRWIVVAVVLLIAVRFLALALLLMSGQERDQSVVGGDARRYTEIAQSEGTPYRDYAVEYPPVAYALIRGLAASDDRMTVLVRLGISQVACDLAVAAVLVWGWGRRAGIAYLVLGLPFLPFPYLYLRLDLVSVLLATVGWAAMRKRHDGAGGAVLAISVFAKLWPIALAPLFLIERRWKALVAWAVTGIVALGLWVLWAGPAGPIDVFSFRGARGWQVESLPGVFLHMADSGRANVEAGAWRTGVMPGWGRPALTLLSFGFLALAWWWAARRRREGANDAIVFALAPLAAVLSLLIFAPIISPQYALWLLPFAAILAAGRDRLVAALTLVVGALSTLEFALIHGQIDGKLYATIPVVARNVALVALLIVTLLQLGRFIGCRACGIPSPLTDAPADRAPIPH